MTARKKILIVDDDHDTLDLLEIFLYNRYDIITANNGFEALSKVEEELPALILTDIKMPVMDGIRFFNNLRKNEATKNIPIIAVTSFIQENTAKSLSSMGFNAVLTKPPDSDAITGVIARLLDQENTSTKQTRNKRSKKR
jgi:two-component system, sensor histidine kinase ChiS